MSKFVAGIDWSMTSPAIAIYNTKDKLEFKNCQFFFYHSSKKYDKTLGNIHGFQQKDFSSNEERYDNLSEWAMSIFQKFSVKDVTMEGYAMGASNGLVFNIAENGGLLKHKMWKAGMSVQHPSPGAVKKSFTGKGNAKKIDMHTHLLTSEDVDVSVILDSPADKSPVNDVVDAYAMIYYMIKSPDSKFII